MENKNSSDCKIMRIANIVSDRISTPEFLKQIDEIITTELELLMKHLVEKKIVCKGCCKEIKRQNVAFKTEWN